MSKKQNTDKNEQSNEIIQLVTFNLGSEIFGVDILNIQSINRKMKITVIPNAPDFIEGVINLRGQVIPIISLRKRLNMEAKKLDKDTRFIVMEIENKIVGFIVDSVNEVLRIDSNICTPPPPLTAGIETDYITSVAKLEGVLLILLDINKIMTKKEIEELEV